MSDLVLTAVICTHNRAALLVKTLDSIKAARKPDYIELRVLIVANACSDNTVNILKKYSLGNINFQVAEEPKPGKSNALNYAIKLIDKNIFACFIDDDHRIDNYYFISIIKSINRYPETKIFCGRILPDWTGNEPSWVLDNGQYKIYPLPIPHFEMGPSPCPVNENTKLPGGGNLIIHSSIFALVGPFSTKFGPVGNSLAGSEDSDFILRALHQGIAIKYMPDIVQYHFVDNERLKFSYIIKKSYQRTQTLMLARNPSKQAIPHYLWRKLFTYIMKTILSVSIQKKRFYLVRTAAALGEINGLRKTVNSSG